MPYLEGMNDLVETKQITNFEDFMRASKQKLSWKPILANKHYRSTIHFICLEIASKIKPKINTIKNLPAFSSKSCSTPFYNIR